MVYDMHKTFKKYFILLLLLGIVIISLFWIQNLPIRNAKKVLTHLLNIPAQPLVEAYDAVDVMIDDYIESPHEQTITSLDDTPLRKAYTDMFGNLVSDNFIEGCIRLNEITSLHFLAIQRDFTIKLEKLDILKTNQKDAFLYEAQILIHTVTGKEQEFQITGKIQFNNEGKISSVSVKGRELQLFINNEFVKK